MKNVGRFAIAAIAVYVVGGLLLRTAAWLFSFVSLAVGAVVIFGLGYLAGRSHHEVDKPQH